MIYIIMLNNLNNSKNYTKIVTWKCETKRFLVVVWTHTIHYFFNRYYSSSERNYLQMTLEESELTKTQQQKALENGFQLASLLNRTLILPKFHCGSMPCNFVRLFLGCLRPLDKEFGAEYREHVFLQNLLVPNEVRNAIPVQFKFPSHNGNYLHNRDTLMSELSKYKKYPVLHVTIPSNINLDLNDKVTAKLRRSFDEKECELHEDIISDGIFKKLVKFFLPGA